MLEEVQNIYNSLLYLEKYGLTSIKKKTLRKKLLVALISSLTVFINLYIGLVNYLIFSSIVDASYLKKLESMSKRIQVLDKIDLSPFGITLGNAANLLKGKMNRLYAMEDNKEISQDIIIANNYIACFLSDELPDISIEDLPPNSKKTMIGLLQKDLNSKSSDICELLNELKRKNDSEIKLIREIN